MGPAVVAAWVAIAETVVSIWERVTGRRVKPAAEPPVALPAPPGRRRRWWGGPGGPTGTAPVVGLLALLSLIGCGGPLTGLSRDEIVQMCERVAPCEECPQAPVPDPGPPDVVPPHDGGASPTPPGPATGDELDLSEVEWGDPSPADFPVTAELLLPEFDAKGLRVNLSYSLPGDWKVEAEKVNGNAWVCGKVAGKWRCGTFEWLPIQKPTGFVSKLEAKPGEPPFIQANGPVSKWRPRPGDAICWAVSSMVRGGRVRTPTGRSPFVCGEVTE